MNIDAILPSVKLVILLGPSFALSFLHIQGLNISITFCAIPSDSPWENGTDSFLLPRSLSFSHFFPYPLLQVFTRPRVSQNASIFQRQSHHNT